jgi:predicted nucleic acid-binding protein
MIETIAIDTNIIIRAFAGDTQCQNLLNGKIPVVSIITEIELLSWPQLSPSDYSLLFSFLQDCFIFGLTEEVKDEVIRLRRKYGLKLPDAIIAATAIAKKLPFFSADDIFHRVKELNFIHVQ